MRGFRLGMAGMDPLDKNGPLHLRKGATTVAPFRLLLVCTGNICRSPAAAVLIRKWADEDHPGQFVVESAGVRARVGEVIDPGAAAQLPESVDVSAFRARQVTVDMLEKSDLVLCMDRFQRGICVQMQPQILRRLFTLREFARIAAHLGRQESLQNSPERPPLGVMAGAVRWRQLLRDAPDGRPQTLAEQPTDDDVIDPYDATIREYRCAMRQILVAIEDLRSYGNTLTS